MDDYVSRVIGEYNTWAERLARARVPGGGLTNEGVAAFMCNAISAGVAQSSSEEFKDRFYEESFHEHQGVMYKTEQVGDTFHARILLPPPNHKKDWQWVRTISYGTLGEAHEYAHSMIDRL